MSEDKEITCLRLIQKSLGSIEGHTSFYGCSEKEIEYLKIAFLEAQRNNEPNEFPDLIFKNGFIEHFQVTSANENRKGSQHLVTENTHDREFRKQEEKELQNLNEKGEMSNLYEEHSVVQHSHSNLLNSLKRNIENHLESLDKYQQEYITAVFFIQFTDGVLSMENVSKSLWENQSRNFLPYRASFDKDFLELIQNYRDKISYIIVAEDADSNMAFPYDANFEVFSLNNLNSNIEELKTKDYKVVTQNIKIVQRMNILSSGYE